MLTRLDNPPVLMGNWWYVPYKESKRWFEKTKFKRFECFGKAFNFWNKIN